MSALSRPQKLLFALFAVLAATLYAGSSGSLRFGGEEDEGSGFGGTGRAPVGGSGLGGTGYQPWLGDAGEVRIRVEPDAVLIAEQVTEADIRRIPAPEAVQAPPAIVSAPEFAASHTAEVSITDSIQARLQRDAVTYQRIVESVEGYYPPDPGLDPAATGAAARPPQNESPADAAPITEGTAEVPAEVPAEMTAEMPASAETAPETATMTWNDLIGYLAENRQPEVESDIETVAVTAEPATAPRPNRIRRPDLPQVQRARIVQRPAILPPRVQPMLR